MNKYREQLDSVEPPAGFEGRLSESVLSFTPETRRPYRPRSVLRAVLVAALITLALALTACAAYVALNWDPIFVRRFSPSASQAAQLTEAPPEAAAVSECGGVILRVRQTLGDDRTVYIILDITLPETVPLEAADDGTASAAARDILPEHVWLGPASLTYEDIKGLSLSEYRDVRALFLPFEGSVTVRTEAVDVLTNTLTYLLCCSPQRATLGGKPLTILIDRLVRTSATPFETVLEGPFVVSWTPEPNAASRTYEIRDGDYTRGWVTISPFTLKGELYTSDYENFGELFGSVSLTFRDGRTYMPAHESVGGSYSSPSGSCSFDTQFSDLLLLEDVVSLHMGGYTIELS